MLFKYSSKSESGTAYFAPWFIQNPDGPMLAGWEFDFSTAIASTEDLEGVLVKCVYKQQVWRLTGETDSQGYFEGKLT
jgi:hypothetical protein